MKLTIDEEARKQWSNRNLYCYQTLYNFGKHFVIIQLSRRHVYPLTKQSQFLLFVSRKPCHGHQETLVKLFTQTTFLKSKSFKHSNVKKKISNDNLYNKIPYNNERKLWPHASTSNKLFIENSKSYSDTHGIKFESK